MLIVTPLPAHHTTAATQQYAGKNRFECRTCPYQMVLDQRYFERRTMKLKEVEDVLGGSDSWKNVDKTESAWQFPLSPHSSFFPPRAAFIVDCCSFVLSLATPQESIHHQGPIKSDTVIPARCPKELCESSAAYFRQVQIRSADEPMTTFYKCVVCAAEWREN